MQARTNRLVLALVSTAAVALLGWSGMASAAPTSVAPVELTPVLEQAPTQPAPAPDLDLHTDEADPVEATNYLCMAQCWRDFNDCLAGGNQSVCEQELAACEASC